MVAAMSGGEADIMAGQEDLREMQHHLELYVVTYFHQYWYKQCIVYWCMIIDRLMQESELMRDQEKQLRLDIVKRTAENQVLNQFFIKTMFLYNILMFTTRKKAKL